MHADPAVYIESSEQLVDDAAGTLEEAAKMRAARLERLDREWRESTDAVDIDTPAEG